MKKNRFFLHGVIFLAVLSGLFSASTASGNASTQVVSLSEIVHQTSGNSTASPVVAASQSPQTSDELPPSSIRFEKITIADGLSFSKVDVILQDRQGYIWIGTERGLNKYDGYQFTVYRNDPADPGSLSHDRIYALYEDSLGELWIGTAVGLDRLDRATNTFVHYQAGVGGNPFTGMPNSGASVYVIREDGNGVLWVGSLDGLYYLDPVSQTLTRSPGWQLVSELEVNSDGQLWVGDFGRLYLYDTETGARRLADLDAQVLDALYVDTRGDLWVGASDGLRRMDHSTGSVMHYVHDPQDTNSLGNDSVYALLEDHLGRLWVGTNDGLDLFDRERNRFVHYRYDPSDPYSLGDDIVHTLYEDRSGVLWIGTGRGLSKYSWAANRFTLYTQVRDLPAVPPETGYILETSGLRSLSSDRVMAIQEDRAGSLWAGLFDRGLNRLDRTNGRLTVYRHDPADPNSLSNDIVREIYEDHTGTLWVGTDSGLDQFEPGILVPGQDRYGTFLKDWGLGATEVVWVMTEDRTDKLWIGTLADLYSFDRESGRFTPFQEPGWSSVAVRSLFADETGSLWIGTQGAGLYRWDGTRFTSYLPQTSNPYNASGGFIRSLYTDPDLDTGAVYAGTDWSGLLRYDRASPGAEFQQFTEKDGLAGNRVQCILADANGLLWLGTNRGVSRFDPATQTFRNYDVRDGLYDGETWDCFKNSLGEMFMGGTGGLAAFYPGQIQDNAQPPPIAITVFRLLNQAEPIQLPADGRIQLSYKQNDLSFEFAALDYHASGKNQYAYRMEGVDTNWVSTGTRRFVNYTNLQPGDYVFRVKGSNNDGVWNEEGATLQITILPPFWGTWWFRGLLAVTLLGTALVAYRMRVRSIEARSLELEQQVADRTAELSQANALLEQEIAERLRMEEALAQERASAAVTAERNRLARELHDAVTQTLFSASLVAEALPAAWEKDPQEGHGLLQDLRGLSRGALAEMRTLLLELRPAALLETRLDDLLRQLGEAASGRVGIPVTVQIEGETELHQGALPPDVHIALYRITQEALNNVIKHARAHHATVRLNYSPGSQAEPMRVSLSISDDGRGFDAAQLLHNRLGFGIMQERVQSISGKLTIESQPGHGTQVTVLWQQAKKSEAR